MSAADRIKELTKPTGEEDLLPVAYPEPRLRVEPKQAAVCVSAVLAIVAGWAVTRTPDAAPPAQQWETVAAEDAVPEQLVVSVVGEVANPGLVTLHQGARVADALAVAAPHEHADLLALNQAQLLVDGQQILVLPSNAAAPPGAVPALSVGAVSAGGGLVSINGASATELETLPGVGAATAAAIVAHREANGPFTSLEALMDVKGIGPAKFAALKDQIAL
ncbi:helix-hairpin-helix domain-containing protein [Corynebacterium sp. Q4381]|uniref:ComEA family DNA-binding protein n=1 Tax=Corynebacterium sp. Marseille-Q4381 TaxID=3121597 RepID=UPI002FE5FCA5